MDPRFKSKLNRAQREVEKTLSSLLRSQQKKPTKIHEAMRYSVLAGGKRLRPILTLAAAEALGKKSKAFLPAACAMELIHTYSLIHDDLPSMDNDDLRRGRPTNHKVFGEDMAILAGDALLTEAFRLVALSGKALSLPPKTFFRIIQTVSLGAGAHGMVGGQVADILSDKGKWQNLKRNGLKEFGTPSHLLNFIHLNKTAALIQASLELGAGLAGAPERKINLFGQFGRDIGLAFQIRDDMLDIVGDKKKLGKKGSDGKNKKLTFPALYGLKKSEKLANAKIRSARKALAKISPRTSFLGDLADFIFTRDH